MMAWLPNHKLLKKLKIQLYLAIPLSIKTGSRLNLVKKGETLYAISKQYNTTLEALKKANNLETTLIKTGQNIRVSGFDSSDFEYSSVWTVSKGDTLYNIAKRNNTTVGAIKSLNGLASNLIKIGQKLQLK
jgi:LysM repeat protein